MESRVNKYSSENVPSRSARNARLYREVYGKYDDLDHLPLEDNTDEIDMDRLQEIIQNNNAKIQRVEEENQLNIIEQRKRNIDEQRVYDINKILEKAKYENHKLKETSSVPKIDTSILSTLQNKEISKEDIEKINEKYEKKKDIEEELSMTRELKFKGLSKEVDKTNPLIENIMPNSDLSLDLFEDLKPTENTITTKPIRSNTMSLKNLPDMSGQTHETKEIDVHSGDTSDIDIIKTNNSATAENDFFTSSYEFSDSDFLDGPTKKSNALKIVLLTLAIIVFAGVIAYFVIQYGIGA